MVVSAHTHPRTMMYAATVDVTRVALLRTDGSVVQTTTHAPSDPHNTQINSNDGSNLDARTKSPDDGDKPPLLVMTVQIPRSLIDDQSPG